MRNMLKATTLERKFPLLAVENGCIVSKDGDITHHGGFPGGTARTVHRHPCRVRSHPFGMVQGGQGKVLPGYSIVHKQDFLSFEIKHLSNFFASVTYSL